MFNEPCRILTPDEIKHTERTFLKAEVEALTADNDALEQRIMKYDIIQLHEKKKFKPTFAQVKTTSQMFMLIGKYVVYCEFYCQCYRYF